MARGPSHIEMAFAAYMYARVHTDSDLNALDDLHAVACAMKQSDAAIRRDAKSTEDDLGVP